MLLAAVSLSWMCFPASLSCNPCRYVQNYQEKEKLEHRYWVQACSRDVCFFLEGFIFFFLFSWLINWMSLAALSVFRTCELHLHWVILMIYSPCWNLLVSCLWCCMFITCYDPPIRFGCEFWFNKTPLSLCFSIFFHVPSSLLIFLWSLWCCTLIAPYIYIYIYICHRYCNVVLRTA